MAESHSRSKRTKTGAKRHKKRDKIKAELGNKGVPVTVDKTQRIQTKTRGGNTKQVLRRSNEINVLDPKTKKVKKTELVGVLENDANRHYVRRNIITRGAIVETKLGKAKVTSRPGQDGVVNGVLIKE